MEHCAVGQILRCKSPAEAQPVVFIVQYPEGMRAIGQLEQRTEYRMDDRRILFA